MRAVGVELLEEGQIMVLLQKWVCPFRVDPHLEVPLTSKYGSILWLLGIFVGFSTTKAKADCDFHELTRLKELSYSRVMIERICNRDDIKKMILDHSSRSRIYYRGIDIPPEKFDPFHPGVEAEGLHLSMELYIPVSHASFRNGVEVGTIIKYELPDIFSGQKEEDVRTFVNVEIEEGRTPLPRGARDLDLFTIGLAKVDLQGKQRLFIPTADKVTSQALSALAEFLKKEGESAFEFEPYSSCTRIFDSIPLF